MLTRTLDRRALLRAATLAAGAAVLPLGRLGWAANLAPLGDKAASRRLVVVLLRGAVDGLSVVVPYGDAAYYQARPGIAIKPPQAGGETDRLIALDGHFGLHPALQPLQPFWQQGSLAFVQACGSPDPTRSHFDAQLFMENGTPGISTTPDGWMNRLVGLLPGPHAPTQALSIGPTVPRIMSGHASVANVSLGADMRRPTPLDRPGVSAAFAQLYGGQGVQADAFRQGQAARQAVLADLDHEQEVANAGAPEARGFAQPAARLAKMMRGDPSISLVVTALGGWDTHVNQGSAQGQLANQLRGLGQGLATLATGLGPAYADTLILVMSEFGRTVRENGNGGTDHGHGNVLWVMGGGVAGGRVYGDWPGLGTAQLYQGRDLAVTTDYRTVLSSLVGRHLGLADRQLATLFPATPPARTSLAPMLRA